MAEKNSLQFLFARIITNEFAVIETNLVVGSTVSVNNTLTFSYSIEDKSIGVQARIVMESEKKPMLIISATCYFNIVEEDWVSIFNQEDMSVKISKRHAQHFANLTIGTVRGILHAKTESHPINAVVLPPVNLLEMIKDDIVIVPAKSEADV